MLAPSSGTDRIISALDVSLALEIRWRASEEAEEMANAPQSRMDLFVSVALPMLGVIVVTILGASWALYNKLDQSISEARAEARQDLKGAIEQMDARLVRTDSKLDTLGDRLDEKTSVIIRQISDIRVKQATIEASQ